MFQLFLPYIFIIGFGFGLLQIFNKKSKLSLSIPEFIIASLVIGIIGLIGPMILLASVFQVSLILWITFYFIFSSLLLVSFVLSTFQSFISHLGLYERLLEWKLNPERVLWILLVAIIILYSIYQIIQPLRGWDALNFYFPDAYIYYITDEFPLGNPFTFRPLYKEPCLSLLFSFIITTVNAPYFHFLGPLFLCILTLSTYELGMLFFQDQRKALLGSILSALMPISQTVFFEYAYYQDPAVSAFITASFLFYFKGLKQEKMTYHIISMLSFSLAILSKFNAWSFGLIFIIVTPTARLGKAIRLVVLCIGCGFLLFQGVSHQSLGIIFPIILVFFLVSTLILKQEPPNRSQIFPIIFLIVGAFPLGILWFNRYANFFDYTPYNHFFGTVLVIKTQTGPTGFLLIDEFLYLCQINFGFSILFGISAALALLIPQLIGFWRSSKFSQELVIWFLIFMGMISMSYFGGNYEVVRYFSPIICPLALTCSEGITYLSSRFSSQNSRPLSFDLFCILLCFIFIPSGDGGTPQFLFQLQMLSDLGIHLLQSPQGVLALLIVSNLFFILLVYALYGSQFKFNYHNFSSSLQKILSLSLILILILLPIQANLNEIFSFGENIENFSPVIESGVPGQYEVIEFVKQFCPLEKGGLIVYDMPGLGFQLLRPVFDVFMGDNPFKDIFSEVGSNITEALSIMRSFQPDYSGVTISAIKLSYILVPEKRSWKQEGFRKLALKTPLFHVVYNTLFFDRIYKSSYFSLYELKDNFPFKGVIGIFLTRSDKRSENNLLSYINQDAVGSSIDIWIDLSMCNFELSTNITAQLTLTNLRHQNLQSLNASIITSNQSSVHLYFNNLPKYSFFVEDLFLNISNPINDLSFQAVPLSSLLFTYKNDQWSVNEGKGLNLQEI